MRKLWLCILLWTGAAQAQVVPLPALRAQQVSVSGLSSGAYMAVQFEVAFSRTVIGAGIIAGGPYFCAQGSVFTATTTCSCNEELFSCRVRPGGTRVQNLIAITDWFAAMQTIDPTSALAGHRIWMFSGTLDSVVPQAVSNDLLTYYRHYIDANRIAYKRNLAAEHAMPTDSYGNACSVLGSPYINNCNYDAAGELLNWIYGPLAARSASLAGRFIAFDQSEFIALPTWHGMADVGYLYIPPSCESGGGCRLHVAFHGCQQSPDHIGAQFVRRAGYNAWADNNRLLILYPQTSATLANPKACWDWWAHDDTRYAQKQAARWRPSSAWWTA
ncbi:extracellular catalytic domain type 2 short-chain-length polyhydroxyalkanoate depolymerase [Duganella sp. P38]|uniref:extracellular catalytic domain type 2 short-chain-length polyhydroxyalkanoate depolymerase n=1 Tax=Duganella sp. P38 TaxID=3423949 RepID=UPI003D795978